MAIKRAFPSLVCIVSYPTLLDPGQGRTRVNQRHNTAVKKAIRACLEYHHKNLFPKHFKYGARTDYKYGPRSERTKFIKRKLGRQELDMVMHGKARRNMTSPAWPKYTVRGSTYGTKRVVGTTRIRWPDNYHDRANAKPEHITKKKMTDELERWTVGEEKTIAKVFKDTYVAEMRMRFKRGGRVTKKYWTKLTAQGVY